MHPRDLEQHLRDLALPVVERLGFDLVAVEWRAQTLRFTVDHPDGVQASDCAEVSHRLSPLLDEDDPIAGTYRLEVSSPGIDRPVQRRDDFRRFAGYRARIRLEPGPPRRRYTGVLRGVDASEVLVEVDGTTHRLPLDLIESAQLILELDEFQALADGLPPIPDEPDPDAPSTGASEGDQP